MELFRMILICTCCWSIVQDKIWGSTYWKKGSNWYWISKI